MQLDSQAQITSSGDDSERRQSCLMELGDRLRRLDSTAEIARAAAEVLGRALNCARAGYAVIRGDYAYVEADWTDGEAVSTSGPRPFAALGERFCAPLLAGHPHIVHDVATHPVTQYNTAAFQRVRIGALINVPLMENGVLSALAYAQHTTAHRWSDAEYRLVREVADRTWEAYGRARAIQALRKINASLEDEIVHRTAQRDRMWRLSSDVLLVADFTWNIQSVNPAWTNTLDWAEGDLIGRNLLDLSHPDDRPAMRAAGEGGTASPAMRSFEGRLRRRDGKYCSISWRAVADQTSIHASGRDVTAEREQAEALRATQDALRQAQKMEAVGQLTGGIAHDFNNLLQGITGSLDLAEKRLSGDRPEQCRKMLAAARDSANRAVALTHRLLAFSRRQPLDPSPVQANPLVASMNDLLRRTMGERIEIRVDLAADLWLALCDSHQLENAILNLAINARDAMSDGGRLVLETRNVELDAAYAARTPDVAAGQYVCVSVNDSGVGMSAAVMAQAFEPFFTTKPLGQGTGLGLAMIYGFAKQSGGHARIYSEPGVGTTVKLFLPRYGGAPPALLPAVTPAGTAGEPLHATVLVVEDEDVVRGLIVEVLEALGLVVLEASNGPAGLQLLRSPQPIDLLITDIGLPGLDGRKMANAARLLRPSLKTLFMTGYAETAVLANGILDAGMTMITKPFPIDDLAGRVREILKHH